MSDEFRSLDARESAALEAALKKCRVLADQIESELCNTKPEHFVDKLALADFYASLERAADCPRTGKPKAGRGHACSRRQGPSAPPLIEGNLRPEINSMLWRAWPEAFFESSSGRLKMQQKICRR
jgi:hypothetical protein